MPHDCACKLFYVCQLIPLWHIHTQGGGLGIKASGVAWNTGGELLAVGSYDQRCRLLDSVTWAPLMECDHPATLVTPAHAVVYEEVDESAQGPGGVVTPVKSPVSKEV